MNRAPKTLDDMVQLARDKKWRILPVGESILHMYGTNGEYNFKFVSADGHFEAVYDINGNLVTNPINMGTYNYSSPSNKIEHGILDVAPYLLWGNVPGSSVPSEKTEAKYNGNPGAQKHRQDIINRIGGE